MLILLRSRFAFEKADGMRRGSILVVHCSLKPVQHGYTSPPHFLTVSLDKYVSEAMFAAIVSKHDKQ